jgi:hypothetical protein
LSDILVRRSEVSYKAIGNARKFFEMSHNEEPRKVYCAPQVGPFIEKIRYAGNVTRMGEMRYEYIIVVGKSKKKRPVGRQRLKEELNVKMYLSSLFCGKVTWIQMSQDRTQWRSYMMCSVKSEVLLNGRVTVSFRRRYSTVVSYGVIFPLAAAYERG